MTARTNLRTLTSSLLLALALALLIPACHRSDAGLPATPPPSIVAGGKEDLPLPDAPAYLELYALDIWGQALPQDEVTFGVAHDGAWQQLYGYPIAMLPLKDTGSYIVSLKAPQHEDLELKLSWDGGTDADALKVGKPANDVRHGVASSHDQRTINGAPKPVFTAYVGLRHAWFSAQGRPARRGNAIELLMDGEETWKRVHGDLRQATD
jgi:hypothetical protein